jgi:hypothetical protein
MNQKEPAALDDDARVISMCSGLLLGIVLGAAFSIVTSTWWIP